jgi:hypothetical protein
LLVQVEQEVPGGVTGLVHRLAHAKAAGDVAQHVDAAEPRQRLLHHGLHLRRVEQVARREQPRGAFSAEGTLQQRRVAVDQHQCRALGLEGRGQCAAQMAGGAGDEHTTRGHVSGCLAGWPHNARCRA